MISLVLHLLGVWRWVKSGLSWLLSAAKEHPWQVALVLSFCLSAWLNYGKGKALAERDQARAQIVALVKASDDNRKAAEEQVRQQQAAFDRAAKESQNEYETQLAAARGRAGSYAASHRLRAGQAYQCAPATSSQGQNPGVPDSGPAPGDYIAVRQDDYDALIENTARLQAAHDWAKALIVSGVAEPSTAMPVPDMSETSGKSSE